MATNVVYPLIVDYYSYLVEIDPAWMNDIINIKWVVNIYVKTLRDAVYRRDRSV